MLTTGLPIALQEGLVNASFLIITAIINQMGLTASAAVGVVEKLIVFSMLPTTAIASAVAAITSQHKGAGLMRRARRCLRAGTELSLLFGLLCFFAAQIAPEALVGLFTSDPSVISSGGWYLRAYSLDTVLVCLVFCMNAYFTGSGHPVFPLVHSCVTSCLIRIPLSLILSRQPWASLFHLGFAAPAATLVSFLLCLGYQHRLEGRESLPARL